MNDQLNVEESARAIIHFCNQQLKKLGINAYVCFAELENHIIAMGRTDIHFDMEIILQIFRKNNIKPHIFKCENEAEFIKDIRSKIDIILQNIDNKKQ